MRLGLLTRAQRVSQAPEKAETHNQPLGPSISWPSHQPDSRVSPTSKMSPWLNDREPVSLPS